MPDCHVREMYNIYLAVLKDGGQAGIKALFVCVFTSIFTNKISQIQEIHENLVACKRPLYGVHGKLCILGTTGSNFVCMYTV